MNEVIGACATCGSNFVCCPCRTVLDSMNVTLKEWTMQQFDLRTGDCRQLLKELPSNSVRCCVTSPPYWGLRDYGVAGQVGAEEDLLTYVETLTEIFSEVRRVLTQDGTLWLNLGDAYANNTKGGTKLQGNPEFNENRPSRQATKLGKKSIPLGLKPKDLLGMPWRVAFALQAEGWYLRQDIIWHKTNPMPESVKDRCTKSHEYIFLLTKSEKYFFNNDAIKEPLLRPEEFDRKTPAVFGGRDKHVEASKQSRLHSGKEYTNRLDKKNKRSVWSVGVATYKGAHFATFPPSLIEPCVLAGSEPEDLVLDPFSGAATTGLVALRNGRRFLGLELNPEYVELAEARLRKEGFSPRTSSLDACTSSLYTFPSS